jgi:hypothetical protein
MWNKIQWSHTCNPESWDTDIVILDYPSEAEAKSAASALTAYMSSFQCEKCGTACIDTDRGYITGCEHYPVDVPAQPGSAGIPVDAPNEATSE